MTLASNRRESVIIVGSGITGSCLARLLAERGGHDVTVIDRADARQTLAGSTGLAPGFVAPFHTIEALRVLGKRSADYYRSIPDGFASVGGLEVAFTEKGKDELLARYTLAKQEGVEVEWLAPDEAAKREPKLLQMPKGKGIIAALFFRDAGAANAVAITRHEITKAIEQGAKVMQATVRNVRPGVVVTEEQGEVRADKVVVCSGIWTRELLPDVPCYAVAHPYMYSKPYEEANERHAVGQSPFVRFMEYHVYARDHGERLGFGTYGHDPILVENSQSEGVHLGRTAKGEWQDVFRTTLQRDAKRTLPEETLATFDLDNPHKPDFAFNGIFSVTPDAKPIAGLMEENENDGTCLFACVAVWVTHAYGTARMMANLLEGKLAKDEEMLVTELNPHRFSGSAVQLQEEALKTYNDIYVTKEVSKE